MGTKQLTVNDYLPGKPKDEPPTRNFQAKVEENLYNRAKDKAKAQGYTWDELATGLLKFYLGEDPKMKPKG